MIAEVVTRDEFDLRLAAAAGVYARCLNSRDSASVSELLSDHVHNPVPRRAVDALT